MTDRPIIFSAPMIKALVAGRKWQTRRLIQQPMQHHWRAFPSYTVTPVVLDTTKGKCVRWRHSFSEAEAADHELEPFVSLRFSVGDRLWVKETFLPDPPADHDAWGEEGIATYESWSGTGGALSDIPKALRKPKHVLYRATWKTQHEWRWRPSLFMPRWASRITLAVTDVRVQRLQDINEDDAQAEGVVPVAGQPDPPGAHRVAYRELWDILHSKPDRRWADNPWVVACRFRCDIRNIDSPNVSAEHAARAVALEPM